jgi:uncharacterized protein YciI
MADPVVTWKDIVDRCEGMGVLAKKFYVVFTSPAEGLGKVMENIEEHLAYQHKIEQNGIMFAAGPFANDDESLWQGEGMVIIRAASLAEAEKIAAADPMHSSGARSYRVRPWLMNEGNVTVRVTYSDQKLSVE